MNNPVLPALQDTIAPPTRRKHMRLEILSEDAAEIVQMHRSGMTTTQIGEKLSCCQQKIGDCLKRQDINIKSPYQGDLVWRKRIAEAYAKERTFKGTARQVGVSAQPVKRVLQGDKSSD